MKGSGIMNKDIEGKFYNGAGNGGYVIAGSELIGSVLDNVYSYKRFKSFFSILDCVPSVSWDHVFFGRASTSIEDALKTLSKVHAISVSYYRNASDPNNEFAPIHHIYSFSRKSKVFADFLIDYKLFDAFNIPKDKPENFFIDLGVWNTLPNKYSIFKGFIPINGEEPENLKKEKICNIDKGIFRSTFKKTVNKLGDYGHIKHVGVHKEKQKQYVLEYQFDEKNICKRYEYLNLEKKELNKTLELVDGLDGNETSIDALVEHLYGTVDKGFREIGDIYNAIDNIKRVCNKYKIENNEFYHHFISHTTSNLKELSERYEEHKGWWNRIMNYFGVIGKSTQEIELQQRISLNGDDTIYIHPPDVSDELEQTIFQRCKELPEETDNPKAYIHHFHHLTQLKENILEDYWKEIHKHS